MIFCYCCLKKLGGWVDVVKDAKIYFCTGQMNFSHYFLTFMTGRRRLCKVRSNEAPNDSPTCGLNEDLEDWHEVEDLETPGSADTLVNDFDKLSFTSEPCKATIDIKSGTQKPKSKIMDSLAFLNEARKLSASVKSNRYIMVADDGESLDVNSNKSSDITNVHDSKRFDKDDRNEMFPPTKPSLSSKIHGGFANKPIQGEVCWDLEDEKENSGVEGVTFVHNKLVFTLPQKIANILYPHQLEGIKWLWGLHIKGTGGILGDDMGLGKTMQV